ncbi:hypothetical protein [Gordonia caeni]
MPGAHWKRLADQAGSLGDAIGASDTAAANTAYDLAARFTSNWRKAQP